MNISTWEIADTAPVKSCQEKISSINSTTNSSNNVSIKAFQYIMTNKCKFDFKILLKKLTLIVVDQWNPTRLNLIWRRGERKRSFAITYEKQTSQDTTTVLIVDSKESMVITLHKENEVYKEKNYVFDLEDINGLLVKRLASFTFNIAEYLDKGEEIALHMKPLSHKISNVVIYIQCSSSFLKTGSAGDSDMESNFSHVSDDEDLKMSNLDHVALIQSRAFQRQSQFLNDIAKLNTLNMNMYANISSFGSLPAFRNYTPGGETNDINSTESTVNKLLHQSVEVNEIIHQVKDDDFVVRKSLRIKKIELENEALRVRNVHLLSMMGTYKHDVEMMQLEINELHRLVQELRFKLQESEPLEATKADGQQKEKRGKYLTGWLCKRGVKGGVLGHRWKRRWFVQCHDKCIYYYKKVTSSHHQGYIELDKIIGVEDLPSHKQDKNNGLFNVLTEKRVYQFMAHDEQDKKRWINCLDFIQETGRKTKSLARQTVKLELKPNVSTSDL